MGLKPSLFRPVTTTDLAVYRYVTRLNGRRGEGHPPLRIAHLSDLHLNDEIPPSYYQQVIDHVNAAEPDLVFFTGDFVNETEGIYRFPELACQLESRLGSFAIFGNHDYWADPVEVARVVSSACVDLTGNGWRRLEDGARHLLIIGCEEPWSPERLALPEACSDDLILALSHSADSVYELSAYGASAVFTGHYHAGQFQIPGFGPLFIPSKYGRRFYHGHYEVGKTHLFVSAGVGASHPARRLYCPPDLFIVDLI